MEITNYGVYEDGTIEITTDEGIYCYDDRIASPTRGAWFTGYPDPQGTNKLVDTAELDINIFNAIRRYQHEEQQLSINKFIQLLIPRVKY